MNTPPIPTAPKPRFQSLARAFQAYARWLVGISWKLFFVLALLLLIFAGILSGQPFLTIDFNDKPARVVKITTQESARPADNADRSPDDAKVRVEVTIDEKGIRVREKEGSSIDASAQAPRTAVTSAASDSLTARQQDRIEMDDQPADSLVLEHRDPIELGPILMDMVVLFILASMILKLAYKGRMQAEQQASEATAAAQAASAVAEAEQLRRQLVEARIATMQAQIEPHFLFNTLASIEHLIQTNPERARQMQQHLIALLRASMPQLREAIERPLAALEREMDMVRPYLAIQKIRMEERLEVRLSVPEGLLSAELPPLMLQTLVENAIKHGLEPQPGGGFIEIGAQVIDGQLVLDVVDNGAGLLPGAARALRPQGGTGLHNIEERLRLHYGQKAALEMTPRPGGGTHARLRLPYRVVPPQTTASPL
jgi:signal transduction histidine kinase